jgi:hypothetical protein
VSHTYYELAWVAGFSFGKIPKKDEKQIVSAESVLVTAGVGATTPTPAA